MRHRPFLVNVALIRRNPGSRRREQREGELEELATSTAHVPPGGAVAVDAVLEWSSASSILVTAAVTAPWAGECRRCLGPATGTLRSEVRELYEDGGDADLTYPLEGDQLDLAPLARDAVLLELPLAPLCVDECAGLCPTCGANRNEGSCRCAPQDTDARWAALDALKTEE